MATTTIDRLNGINSGVAIKAPCRAATTANITLSGEQTVDGIALVAGDRVLVKDQTTGANNGIYDVATSGWQRSPDFDGSNDVVSGTLITVNLGTVNLATIWRVSNTGTIAIDTTVLTIIAYNTTLTGVSAFMQTVLDDVDAATARTTLGVQSPPFVDSTAIIKGSADATKLLRIEVDGYTTGTTRVMTPPDADFIPLTTAVQQTATNKKFEDSSTTIVDNGDNTKQMAFQCSGITTATTRTLTVPDASGTIALAYTPVTNSLSGDVALSATGSYFDGPSVAQGTSGTWLASGTVTVTLGTANHVIYAKLWDGTTVIASVVFGNPGASGTVSASLSGYLTNPAANIKISVRDTTATDSTMKFNSSGNSKDSTLTAIRVG